MKKKTTKNQRGWGELNLVILLTLIHLHSSAVFIQVQKSDPWPDLVCSHIPRGCCAEEQLLCRVMRFLWAAILLLPEFRRDAKTENNTVCSMEIASWKSSAEAVWIRTFEPPNIHKLTSLRSDIAHCVSNTLRTQVPFVCIEYYEKSEEKGKEKTVLLPIANQVFTLNEH